MEGQLRRLILALLIVDYIAVIVHFSQTIQFENEARLGIRYHHKRTAPEFICDRTETSSSRRSQSSCFGAHLSVIAVFTPAQMNCTYGAN